MIQSNPHSTAATTATGLVELLESGIPEASALQSALRAIPLKWWRVSIESEDAVATWAVRATFPNSAGEPLQVHLERKKSFEPNDTTIEVTERFDGRIVYSPRGEVVPVCVELGDRPMLVQELLQSLSAALGEINSLTGRWQQQLTRAEEYATRERTAVLWLKGVATDGSKRRPYSAEAAQALVAEQLERMSAASPEGDSFELLELVGAVRVERGPCSACIVTARVQQIDSEQNDYPFRLGIAIVSGSMPGTSEGVFFDHTVIATSDFSRIDLGLLETLVKSA